MYQTEKTITNAYTQRKRNITLHSSVNVNCHSEADLTCYKLINHTERKEQKASTKHLCASVDVEVTDLQTLMDHVEATHSFSGLGRPITTVFYSGMVSKVKQLFCTGVGNLKSQMMFRFTLLHNVIVAVCVANVSYSVDTDRAAPSGRGKCMKNSSAKCPY